MGVCHFDEENHIRAVAFTQTGEPDVLRVDSDKRRQLLRQMEEFLLKEQDPYIPMLWKSWTYLVSDKVRTEAGAFVTQPSLQTVHKNEHVWLEK